MKRILLLWLLVSVVTINADAVRIGKFECGLNESTRTAIIMGATKDVAAPGGILTIPEYVTYEEKNYLVTKIDDNAFYSSKFDPEIEWINFPPTIVEVGTAAFRDNKELWSMSWPGDATKKIGAYAFAGCSKLQVFPIPPLLEEMGRNALEGCTCLTGMIFGGNLKEVPYEVCKGCTGIGEILIFPGLFNNLKKIQDNAFEGCTSLRLFILCADLDYFGSGVFKGCTKLTNISSQTYYPCKYVEDWSPFEKYHYQVVNLEIPAGTTELYRNTPEWGSFLSIAEVEETGVSASSSFDASRILKHYSIDGKSLAQPQRGVNIEKMSDGTTKKVIKD